MSGGGEQGVHDGVYGAGADDGVLRHADVHAEAARGGARDDGACGGAAPDAHGERRRPALELIYLDTGPYRPSWLRRMLTSAWDASL